MSEKAKKVSDSEVDDLERLVPDRAMDATLSAYFRAVSMTQSGVLRTDAGNLVRVARDGSKTVVAKAKPRRKVTVGEVIVPRLRVFAGPNGSGKSTIKGELSPALIKTYVNADELEKEAKATGFIDLSAFGIDIMLPELRAFHAQHHLLIKKGMSGQAERISLLGTKVDYRRVQVDSYFASVISDLIRQRLIDREMSFTFETVMSHPSKVEIMKEAQARGYRTYLYFVSTENPEINVDRVAIRVHEGGHPVDPSAVRDRYIRSLGLLSEAVSASNRAYIFDNSGDRAVLLAEVTDGTQLEYRTEEIPDWFFEAYVDKVDH